MTNGSIFETAFRYYIYTWRSMKLSLSFVLKVSLAILGSIFASGKVAFSQVTPDSTDINTQVNQNGNVAEITGGQTKGGNLFHSFQDFSVPI